MNKLLFFVVCICQLGFLVAESNQLIQSLLNQAEKIAATVPTNYASLVTELKTNGLDGYDSCEVSGFDAMIAKYDFAQSIVDNFKLVTMSESIEFQSFNVNIKNEYADLIEFIGTAMNYNGTIQIAFIFLYSEGTPVPQYNCVKNCHSCHLFFKCCETTCTERSFTQEELNTITDAVRGLAYIRIVTFLQVSPQRLTDFPQRAIYLLEQNEWDVAMSSWLGYEIEKNSTCYTDIESGYKTCNSQKTSDEQNACMVKTIPETQEFEACILVMCSMFYFDQIQMPLTDQACFNIFYPNAQNLYDFKISGHNQINTVHFWDEQ